MNVLEAIQLHHQRLGTAAERQEAMEFVTALRGNWEALDREKLEACTLATKQVLDKLGMQYGYIGEGEPFIGLRQPTLLQSPDLLQITRDIVQGID